MASQEKEMSLEEVRAEQQRLAELEKKLLRQKKSEAIESVAAIIREYGLTAQDLEKAAEKATKSQGRKRRASGPVAPKYRSPEGWEWSGRGRAPRWVTDHEAEGGKREDFLIEKRKG